ncbi:MAG: 50S ribosome-binding GTPase, partial [Planctomycetaceae bacterium]|nr:50S ribosome-binding GTPase [Planctomycetaceae bacterium]
MPPIGQFAAVVHRLHAAVLQLQVAASGAGVAPLAAREWFELLEHKLIPQLTDDAFLVVAVVGGTNIGKSVVFNHIAGSRASASSPLASGTKHPVCLTPVGFAGQHDLRRVFPGFELIQWDRADAALEDSADDRLFWRENAGTPPNLLVIDTPDVDSDARINWRRADQIRRSADLLVAVLTQQKYNDAAVKQFFRQA